MTRIAIIPARGQSKRLPKKNIIKIDNKPLIGYPIEQANQTGLFDEVFVSTEDEEIAEISKSFGAKIINRPNELATDTATINEVCLHALKVIHNVETFCMIYATAFLLKTSSILESFQMLDRDPQTDFVIGTSTFENHPFKAMTIDDKGFLKALHPELINMKSQFYPEVFANNGTFQWARSDAFRIEKTFTGIKSKSYLVPRNQVSDIDTMNDLNIFKKKYFLSKKKKFSS